MKPTDLYQARVLRDREDQPLTVEFTHETEGLQVTKLYQIRNDASHTIDLSLILKNLSTEPKQFPEGYTLGLGTGVHKLDEKSEERFFFDGRRTNAIIPTGLRSG